MTRGIPQKWMVISNTVCVLTRNEKDIQAKGDEA